MMRRLAIVLAVCAAITCSAVPQVSRAEIDADAGAANGVTLCGMLYSAGHDPSGLWSRLNSKATPPIKIIATQVPTDGTGTVTKDNDDGIQIFWEDTPSLASRPDRRGASSAIAVATKAMAPPILDVALSPHHEALGMTTLRRRRTVDRDVTSRRPTPSND